MKWIWEKRVEGYFAVPQIATFIEGWTPWKGDLSTKLPPQSEVFVRELVQNFMDAARSAEGGTGPKPSLKFEFVNLEGPLAETIYSKLDLQSLAERYQSLDSNRILELRLPDSSLVLSGKARKRLPLLVVTETGTTGMFGEWDRTSKPDVAMKMRDALLATTRGITNQGLGSYGEGKKAVIGVSNPRCLFAYTVFSPDTNEAGVSARFFGGTYWQEHVFDDTVFGGFAGMGALDEASSRPRPLDDEQAHAAVAELGISALKVRSKSELGTTYLFVEPNVTPEQIAESLARNWWPVLESGDVGFSIVDSNGSEVKLPDLQEIRPFIQVYRQQESHAVEWSNSPLPDNALSSHVEVMKDSAGVTIGVLKLGVDFTPTTGWSRKDPEKNTSIVALVREGMLISYQQIPRSNKLPIPYVRGVFEVKKAESPDAEKLLRSVEPPLHNKWVDRNQNLSSQAKNLATFIYDAITDRVVTFRLSQVEEEKKREVDLQLFSDAFSVSGARRVVTPPPPPPTPPTPWSLLNDDASVLDVGNGQRQAVASRTVQLSNRHKDAHVVEVRLGWEVLEDGRWVDATSILGSEVAEIPEGFNRSSISPWVFQGTVTVTPAVFRWSTRSYRELWTLRPYMMVESYVTEVLEVENE